MGSLVAGATGAFYDVEPTNMQPCPFNQLCRCSRGGPEVGMVYCEDIPLGDVPNGINNTKSFAINLRRNGLRRIEEDLFHRTGKNRLETKQTQQKNPPKNAKVENSQSNTNARNCIEYACREKKNWEVKTEMLTGTRLAAISIRWSFSALFGRYTVCLLKY